MKIINRYYLIMIIINTLSYFSHAMDINEITNSLKEHGYSNFKFTLNSDSLINILDSYGVNATYQGAHQHSRHFRYRCDYEIKGFDIYYTNAFANNLNTRNDECALESLNRTALFFISLIPNFISYKGFSIDINIYSDIKQKTDEWNGEDEFFFEMPAIDWHQDVFTYDTTTCYEYLAFTILKLQGYSEHFSQIAKVNYDDLFCMRKGATPKASEDKVIDPISIKCEPGSAYMIDQQERDGIALVHNRTNIVAHAKPGDPVPCRYTLVVRIKVRS